MSSLIDLAWKVVPSVLSGAGGVVGTIWKVTKNLETRVRDIELIHLPNIRNAFSSFRDGKYPEDVAALKKLVDNLKTETDKEFDALYGELRGRGKERREERRLTASLTANYLELQQRVSQCETAINKLNEAFTQHAKGQQEQWQEISRALGHIEGWLRAMSSRRTSSGEFQGPPPKLPRG